MSEAIKPDLILNMKREWFAKIWNNEKTIEYREVKPYWTRRIGEWGGRKIKFVEMRLGYRKEVPVMLLQVWYTDIGPCPYDGWDGDYYRLHFVVVSYYWRRNGRHMLLLKVPKMKEHK